MTSLPDLMGEDHEEFLSLLSRFLDPGCHSEQGFAALAREVVHSPALGDLAQEILARADKMGMKSPADALDAWREKTRGLLYAFCCAPDPEVVESLMGEPYRPGLDRPFAWFERCCDGCYGVFMRALKWQRYLCADSAFDAWNEMEDGGPVGEALRRLEAEESLRFTDTGAGLDACLDAYRLSKKAMPRKPGRLEEPRRVVCLSVHAVAAARLMNAYRYTSDIPRSRGLMKEVEKLVPACAAFHLAEVNALLGVLKSDLGDTDEALRRLRASIDGFREMDRHLSGKWTVQISETEREAGEDSYLSSLQKAMMLLDVRRDSDLHKIAGINLSMALVHLDRPNDAQRVLDCIDFDNHHFVAAESFIRAMIDKAHDNMESAFRRICVALDEYASIKRPVDVAMCLLLRGEVQQKRGHFSLALQDLAMALTVFDSLDLKILRTDALEKLRRALKVQNVAEAAHLARTVREQFAPLPKRPGSTPSSPLD